MSSSKVYVAVKTIKDSAHAQSGVEIFHAAWDNINEAMDYMVRLSDTELVNHRYILYSVKQELKYRLGESS